MIMTTISPASEPDYEALVIQAQQVIAQHRHTRAALEPTTILFYRTNFARLMRQSEEVLSAVDNHMMTPEQADLVQRPAAKGKRGRRQTLRGGSLRARLNGPAHVDAWRLGCRKVMADQAAGAAV